ncbi:hypothetical protein BpHYR1_014409 [Brachionus plicatilis]|uniref:Uncharacterized protein n=1 Tax=Brachionus plicatilis TaxID=10195 RepID=A0A3M7QBA5_BRAPC|nr:hypothetical protein BpHYR1_014409 [Brachionus plicatilis]
MDSRAIIKEPSGTSHRQIIGAKMTTDRTVSARCCHYNLIQNSAQDSKPLTFIAGELNGAQKTQLSNNHELK